MSDALPVTYLARHGETAWSVSGQHTGLTDLPLTERGEANARRLVKRLEGVAFAKVFTQPVTARGSDLRARGLRRIAERDPDLVEWNYGELRGTDQRRTFTASGPPGTCSATGARAGNRRAR